MTEIKQRTTAEYQVNHFKVRLVIYLSYIVQGFALIILAQTVQQLSTLWQSSIASTTAVVSSIGIGKLIAYPILGELSDHLDRKNCLVSQRSRIFCFYIITINTYYFLAVIVTTLAGLANAALDAVAYPTLLEINHGKSSGNVLIKAMISLGEGLLPIILVTLINQKIWFGWLYWLATAILIVNLSTMLSIKSEKFYTLKNQTTSKVIKNKVKWQWDITKILFLIYGFSSMWLMLHFTQWVTRYFHVVQSFTTVNSHLLMTFYSIGSLVGVGLLFLITNQKWIREARLLVLTAIGTIVGLAVIVSSQEMRLASLGCFIFGISAAGGSLQLGLSQLIAHNSKFSGRLTGLYFFFGSVAFF